MGRCTVRAWEKGAWSWQWDGWIAATGVTAPWDAQHTRTHGQAMQPSLRRGYVWGDLLEGGGFAPWLQGTEIFWDPKSDCETRTEPPEPLHCAGSAATEGSPSLTVPWCGIQVGLTEGDHCCLNPVLPPVHLPGANTVSKSKLEVGSWSKNFVVSEVLCMPAVSAHSLRGLCRCWVMCNISVPQPTSLGWPSRVVWPTVQLAVLEIRKIRTRVLQLLGLGALTAGSADLDLLVLSWARGSEDGVGAALVPLPTSSLAQLPLPHTAAQPLAGADTSWWLQLTSPHGSQSCRPLGHDTVPICCACLLPGDRLQDVVLSIAQRGATSPGPGIAPRPGLPPQRLTQKPLREKMWFMGDEPHPSQGAEQGCCWPQLGASPIRGSPPAAAGPDLPFACQERAWAPQHPLSN